MFYSIVYSLQPMLLTHSLRKWIFSSKFSTQHYWNQSSLNLYTFSSFTTNEDISFICVARTTRTHRTIYKREQGMSLPLHARPLPSPRKNGLTVDNKPLPFLLYPQEREGGPERALCGNFPRKEFCDFVTSSLEITRRTETGMGLTQDWTEF